MPKNVPFVHLHLHTSYSLLDGACRTPDLVDAALKLDMPAVAITDHGVMYGIVDFYKAAREKGLKPILGCEVYEAPGSRKERKADRSQPTANHLVLLASDLTGYANLIKLVSSAHLEGFYYKPRIDREILARHHEGLIGLSGCLKGRIASALLGNDEKSALREAGEYSDILGKDNFFIELQDHGLPDQLKVNPGLIEVARRAGLPLVATNDVHYIKKEHAEAHEALLCIQTGTVLSDPNHMRYGSNEFYLKSGAEMQALFGELPGAIENSLEIAQRCCVEISFNETFFPKFSVPEGYSAKNYLIELCRRGVKEKYGVKNFAKPADAREQEIMDRMNYEIGIIEKTGFVGYFLVVSDAVRFARENNIPVGPGRGSGAGSLVSYAIGITGFDPLRYNLVFERFLNPERVSPPDFDIDFCQFRRGEVIEYVRNKYGRENVAQIITFGSLGAKTVIRDVGRVLEVPLVECDRLAKMVPPDPKMTLEKAMADNPELKKVCASDPNAKKIMQHAFVLEGLFRHAGTHAAGVVFGGKPLENILPLTKDKNGEVITQYSKDYVDALGLLKADFLGLKTLTVIDEAVKLVAKTRGVAIDLNDIPMDDEATLELLNLGNTVGVFQLESKGMRDLVRRIGIDKIEDLIAMIALFRPGPMNMLDDYVNRKSGKVKITYDHPLLKPVLAETYGVMLYQEQVQQASHVLAGYTLGQGDILRRAMGKKKPEEMEKQRKVFIEGCRKKNNIPASKAEKIFDNIAKFAGYGFNKSHSTGYAIIAWQTAWLKAHYPEEFMAALISSEIGNTDKLPVFTAEAMEMVIKILPPDVNTSGVRFIPLEGAIRFGLAGIKNVGEGAAAGLVAEREKNGPFKGLVDFCSRVDLSSVNRKCLETLVRCGAFDSFGLHRARLFENVGMAISRGEAAQRDKRMGQRTLFALMDESEKSESDDDQLPDCPKWHENELFNAEKELLGIYLSGHPLSQYESTLKRYRLSSIAGVVDLPKGTATRVGGLVAEVQKKVTKKDKSPMAILKIEGLEGFIEAVVFPEAYARYQSLITENAILMLCGTVDKEESGSEHVGKLITSEIYSMDAAPGLFSERVSIHLAAANRKDGQLEKIKALIKAHPGRVPLVLRLLFPTGEEVTVKADSSCGVTPSRELIHALEHLLGEDSVYVAVRKAPLLNPQSGRRWNKY